MQKKIAELEQAARRIRANVIHMTTIAGSGHPGPSFSIVEILTALYFSEMQLRPDDPEWNDRDRFVLSKGHAAPALYAVLIEKGIFPHESLEKFRRKGSPFQGHPDAKAAGVEATSGSLGTGLSQAVGMALGAKKRKSSIRVFAVIGDGECDEGQIWEAALFASHHKLDNLTVFLDHNHDQFEGTIEEVLDLAPLEDKWISFGWEVFKLDGHDFTQILNYFKESKSRAGKPKIAIAETKKGYGVSFMEGNHDYHARSLSSKEAEKALKELSG